MHEKVLPPGSVRVLNVLEGMSDPALSGWVLAGGTGLALQMGHRVSADFDFFRTDDMDVRRLADALSDAGSCETLQDGLDTRTVLLDGVKLSFFSVRDPFLFPPQPYRFFGLAAIDDIALMKLAAISGRGCRRDFIDLYTILMSGRSLESLFALLPDKYGAERINTYHILKSLTYFEDAETEPMPAMLEPFDWNDCKAFFVREARKLVL